MKPHRILVAPVAAAMLFAGCTTLDPSPVATSAPSRQAEPRGHATPAVAADIAAMQHDIATVIRDLQANQDGAVYAAAVEGTNPDDLAVTVVLVDGRELRAGDTAARFPLMSVSKPFTYALAVEQRGPDFMLDRIGVSATGLPYNSVTAGAVRRTSEQNPMVNAGAIATHSYIEGPTPAAKTGAVVAFYSRLADAPLSINRAWRATPRALTYTLAYQMKAADRLVGDVEDVANRYLESNIVAVDVGELARMGAAFASGGIQPGSGQRVMQRETVRAALSAMVIAGMYEDSGRWWTRVGIPAKSGVSGAILAVVPGWGAIAAYSPRLDPAGNSVRAALAIERLADAWNLHAIDRLIDAGGGVAGR